ncbi:MAG: transcriptional regulator PpsR [Rhodobacteraceae bacterium]|nr:transcriptional regulator PpsR [Paracoccaceae bacterium]
MDTASVVLQDSFLAPVLTSFADVCLEVTPDGIVVVAQVKPEVAPADEVAGWIGADLANLVDPGSARRLHERLEGIARDAQADTPGPVLWAELTHLRNGESGFPVRYAMHRIADTDRILMLGQDQRPIIEIQQQLLNAQVALERDYEAQREIDTRYRILMDFTVDAIVLVSLSNGQVVDINHAAAAMLDATRSGLIGARFADCFAGRSNDDLLSALEVPDAAGSSSSVEVEAKTSQRRLQLTGKLFRASGEQLVMVRVVDPDHVGVGDGQLASHLRQLFHHGSDAIVFTDRDGNILAASETFLNLTDAPVSGTVRGRSMADFLGRGAVDLRVLLDNARRSGQLRMYATRVKTDFGAQLAVEISATWLDDEFDPVLALVIRNASSATSLRVEGPAGQDQNMQNVIELVGSSALKDIVSETTEVIEKICIETAIELTRNNRVAAAEMLGLSRQSLYVKLRKYGLLSREDE